MTSRPSKPSARDTILARRALYLSTALAAIGCTNSKNPQPPDPDSSTAHASATTPTPVVTAASAAPYDKVLAERPPLNVPDDLPLAERAQLQASADTLERKYAAIGKVWRNVPACDPSAPSCKPAYDVLEKDAAAMYRMFDSHFTGGCPGANGRTGSLQQREQIHARYQQSLIKRLESHLSDVAKAHSYASEGRLQQILSRAKEPPPMPCLSPCMMPDVRDIFETVPFPKGSATISADAAATTLNRVLLTQRSHGNRATLAIRGHADPSEPNHSTLAQQRAKAVHDWLVAHGAAARQLNIEILDTKLPIAQSASEDEPLNIRVDFLVTETK